MTAELAGRMRPLAREFFAICDRHHIAEVAESRTVASARERLRALFGLKDTEQF